MSTIDTIKNQIAEHPVLLYMKAQQMRLSVASRARLYMP